MHPIGSGSWKGFADWKRKSTIHSARTLVSADHGFTYGRGLGSETRGQQRLDGRHRCVELAGKPTAGDLEDDSIAYLDKGRLSLPVSYLAAVGRHFGRDTVSGWVMSHGGLLPEEVIIPVVDPHPLPLSQR
jgi:hypothetical protein